MSVEYEIYTPEEAEVAIRDIIAAGVTSPVLEEFNDGPFTIQILRDVEHGLTSFSIASEGPLKDGDTLAACRRTEAAAMQSLLRDPSREEMERFFGQTPDAGLAPLSLAPFNFAEEYAEEEASDFIECDEPLGYEVFENARLRYSLLASGEGWCQLILAHIIAHLTRGLFWDPQAGESRLYRN